MKPVPSAIAAALLAVSFLSCVDPEPCGTDGRPAAGARQADGRCLHELSTEWEYYPGLFLGGKPDRPGAGELFDSTEALARRTVLEFRDNGQRKAAWKKFLPYEGFDYGSYRLVVEFSDPRPKELLLRVPFFDMAVELFIQGEPAFSNGTVGTSAEATTPRVYHPVVIEASSVTDRLEIVLQVANYHFPRGGVRDYLVLGDPDSLARYLVLQTYIEAALVGALLMSVFANLVLAFLSRDPQAPLFLLFMNVAAIVLTLVNGTAALGQLGLKWEAMNRLHYAAISLEFLFGGLYLIRQVAPERWRRTALVAHAAVHMPFVAMAFMASIAFLSSAYHVEQHLTLPVFIGALVLSAWGAVKGDRRKLFIFMTIAVLLTLFWVDSAELIPVNQFTYASLFGIVLFTFLNIGMMAWRVRSFSAELKRQVEERTRELVQEREQVEDKVRGAVREIREKDDLISLQARQAATGEMIDFIAHQWKQSLYAISLHAELLRSRIRQDGSVGIDFARKPLDSIQLVMDEMVRGMDVLRNFTSPTRHAERFELAAAAEETMDLLRDMFSVKRVGLKLEGDRNVAVFGSSQELKQVIMNLLVNAQEAISREPNRRGMVVIGIRSEVHPGGGMAVLEVRDDGGGIPDDIIATVFDKFTSGKPAGSGLGLYLSKMIVERHFGGSISARNEGGGAVFTVRLPVAGQVSASIVTTLSASIPALDGRA